MLPSFACKLNISSCKQDTVELIHKFTVIFKRHFECSNMCINTLERLDPPNYNLTNSSIMSNN